MTLNKDISAQKEKLAKGQFRCFNCRKVFAQKEGGWYTWKSFEAHLCKTCEAQTQQRPERQRNSR